MAWKKVKKENKNDVQRFQRTETKVMEDVSIEDLENEKKGTQAKIDKLKDRVKEIDDLVKELKKL